MLASDPTVAATLRAHPFFTELTESECDRIQAMGRVRLFPKGKLVFQQGDPFLGFYLVIEGRVKVYRVSEDGREFILHVLRPGETFAEIPLFEGRDYPATAQTLERSRLFFIPAPEFMALIDEVPRITLRMLAGLAKRFRAMANQLEDLSLHEVQGRLARYLLDQATANGTIHLPRPAVRLDVTKATLAAHLGTVPETVSRTLRSLQEQGLIRVSGATMFLTHLPGLRTLLR